MKRRGRGIAGEQARGHTSATPPASPAPAPVEPTGGAGAVLQGSRSLSRRPLLLAPLALPVGAALRVAGILPAPALLPGPARAAEARRLNIGISQYPSTFHPNIDAMAAKSYLLGFTQRPLTAYGPDWHIGACLCDPLPTLQNGLAEAETTPEGKPGLKVTIRLRPGLKWGDGTPVSSADLHFAWEAGRNFATGFGSAEFYRSAYALDVLDTTSVALHLDKATFDYNSFGTFQPLPAHLERPIWQADPAAYHTRSAYETDTTNPALWNGPYRVARVQPGAVVELQRNPAWAGEAPAFDVITIRTVESSAALEAQLLAGQIDMIAGELGLPVEQAVALERRAGNRFRFAYKPGLVYEHMDIRLDNPVLADKRVRQALLLALDREQITTRLFEGRQKPADTLVNPLDGVADPDVKRYPFDKARAIALLEAAGWQPGPGGIRRNGAGQTLSFDLLTTAGNRGREAVEQVAQAMWRAVGAEARIGNQPPRVMFGESLSQMRYQGLALYAWISAPENVPRSSLHSDEIPRADRNWSGQNYPGFRNAEMDALLEKLPVTLKREDRLPLWHRLQAIYAEELPALPLWFRSEAHIWPLWLSGVQPTGHLDSTSLQVEQWRVA